MKKKILIFLIFFIQSLSIVYNVKNFKNFEKYKKDFNDLQDYANTILFNPYKSTKKFIQNRENVLISLFDNCEFFYHSQPCPHTSNLYDFVYEEITQFTYPNPERVTIEIQFFSVKDMKLFEKPYELSKFTGYAVQGTNTSYWYVTSDVWYSNPTRHDFFGYLSELFEWHHAYCFFHPKFNTYSFNTSIISTNRVCQKNIIPYNHIKYYPSFLLHNYTHISQNIIDDKINSDISLYIYHHTETLIKYSLEPYIVSQYANRFKYDQYRWSRVTQYPIISCDTYRAIADHIYDDSDLDLDFNDINNNDIIFIGSKFIPNFFDKIFPNISSRVILITSDGDDSLGSLFSKYILHPNIIAWFGQNYYLRIQYINFFHIPIGIAPQIWPHGKMIDVLTYRNKFIIPFSIRPYELYINYRMNTNLKRKNITDYVVEHSNIKKIFITTKRYEEQDKYYEDLVKSKFILCPPGNGIDTHRVWEALYFGAIPIVWDNGLTSLYDKLPVIIVNNETEITRDNLNIWYRSFLYLLNKNHFSFEKLFAPYYYDLIFSFKDSFFDYNNLL